LPYNSNRDKSTLLLNPEAIDVHRIPFKVANSEQWMIDTD